MAIRRTGKGLGMPQLAMFVVFVAIGLYLLSLFSGTVDCTQADVDDDNAHGCTAVGVGNDYNGFKIPVGDQLSNSAMIIVQIITLVAISFAAYAAVIKISGGAMSKRDAFTLILLGLGMWWMWNNVLQDLFNADSILNISFAVGQKLGFL